MLLGLIRTIGTVVLIWFVFRWLDRMSRKWANFPPRNTDRKTNQGAENKNAPQDTHLGDYVDFEELSDKD